MSLFGNSSHRVPSFIPPPQSNTHSIPIRVSNTDELFKIEASVPGVTKSEVKLALAGMNVKISYTKPDPSPESDVLFNDLPTGDFVRTVSLGNEISNVTPSQTRSVLVDGILTICIDKTQLNDDEYELEISDFR